MRDAFRIEPTGYADPLLPRHRVWDMRPEARGGNRLLIAECFTIGAANAHIEAHLGNRDWQTISDGPEALEVR